MQVIISCLKEIDYQSCGYKSCRIISSVAGIQYHAYMYEFAKIS